MAGEADLEVPAVVRAGAKVSATRTIGVAVNAELALQHERVQPALTPLVYLFVSRDVSFVSGI